MALALIAILAGFLGLIWSADRFVAGAAGTAKNLGMSPILIGLTIVSLGTSAPEIIVSAEAALASSGDIAIGNALGSNLANIGLVLGITALIAPLPIARALLRREIPLLLIATFSIFLVFWDNHLSRFDGFLLLAILIGIMTILVRTKSHEPNIEHDPSVEAIPTLTQGKAWFLLLTGLLILTLSAKVLIWGAKETALLFGVSELIIGLTVIAIGTSLPELATTVVSAMKGHHDIALGNIMGSNLFNMLGVIPVAALIQPMALQPEVVVRDYAFMTGLTLLLAAIIYLSRFARRHDSKPVRLGRRAGALLLLCYAAYYCVLFPIY